MNTCVCAHVCACVYAGVYVHAHTWITYLWNVWRKEDWRKVECLEIFENIIGALSSDF